MGATWGDKLKLSIFGESHGPAIGIVIDGLPAGFKVDFNKVTKEMERRKPGSDPYSSTRNEGDNFEILSGFFNERTTGSPLCCIINNNSQRSRDYDKLKNIARPGHADYTGFIKYKGFNDYRGGGHFSGRLTAPLVFAGAIAKQLLDEKNIFVGSHILSVAKISDSPFKYNTLNKGLLERLLNMDFPVIEKHMGEEMKGYIQQVKEQKDSVGGIIEAAVLNVPGGLGFPFFNSVESKLSSMIFSIPAVKGIEFGEGFNITGMKGSEANDEYIIEGRKIATKTNHNGGILGGITNGMPIVFKAAFKPTPSIGLIQNTVDMNRKKPTEIEIDGRHDPCILKRAVPVVEGATALVILDLLLEEGVLI